jgi:hypothetical protein
LAALPLENSRNIGLRPHIDSHDRKQRGGGSRSDGH